LFHRTFLKFGEAICSQTAVLRKNAGNLRIADFSCYAHATSMTDY